MRLSTAAPNSELDQAGHVVRRCEMVVIEYGYQPTIQVHGIDGQVNAIHSFWRVPVGL
jgi:hypothetical protein